MLKYVLLIMCLLGLPSNPAIADTQLTPPTEGKSVEKVIRNVFQEDADTVLAVANCESTGLLHRLPNGRLRPNLENSGAYGVMQVKIALHKREIKRLGLPYNIDTDEGYFAYVKYMIEKDGLQPWLASKSCWKNEIGKPFRLS